MNVLLICLVGIAGCVALVFAVETLVAFCFHEEEQPATGEAPVFGSLGRHALLGSRLNEGDMEKAA